MNKLSLTLNKEFLIKLDTLNFTVGKRLNSGFQGIRRSCGKGDSVEFADFKPYSYGDDVKRADWNSYARFGKLFIKQFLDERQALFNIFIDTSESMVCGNAGKGYYSKVLAASIAYVCLKRGDRLNIFSCKNDIISQKLGVSSKSRFKEVVEFLDNLEYGGDTDIGKAIRESEKFNTGPGISFILSDFFSINDYRDSLNILGSRGNSVSLMQILSSEETSPALDGRFRLFDSETNVYKDILIDSHLLAKYNTALSNMKNDLKAFCIKHGFKYIFADTQSNVLEKLFSLIYANS